MKIEPEPHELLENTLPKKKGQPKINKKLGGGSGAYDSMMVEDSKVHETSSSRGQYQR